MNVETHSAPKKRTPKRDHLKIAQEFQESVLSGTFPCGLAFKAAVERQIADLDRPISSTFPYKFDAELGTKACRFFELLPHADGPLAGKLFVLQPWQVWAVIVMFGWIHAETGYPRFRICTLFMSKGQGKTFLAAAIALYVLCTYGTGDKVYSAATTQEQAALCWKTAQTMLRLKPQLAQEFGLLPGQHAITIPATGALFKALSAKANSLEGKVPSLIVLDEIHAHKTRNVYDNMRSALTKRPDNRLVVISTAGFDCTDTAIGFQLYSYAKHILVPKSDGTRTVDDSQFVLIIEADETDDPWDELTWRKANPNWGISVDPVAFANEAREAQQLASLQPSFMTKHLGRWTSGSSRWVDPQVWAALADKTLRREDFAGRKAFIGVDLAVTRDFTAKVLVFVDDDDEQRRYTVFSDAYLPSESPTLGPSNSEFRTWTRTGPPWLKLLGKKTLDVNAFKADLKNDCETYPDSEVCYDERGFQGCQLSLEAEGYTCVNVRQGAPTLSEPMKSLEAAIIDGRIRHDGSPVMTYCIGNTVAVTKGGDEIKPDRENTNVKIDCLAALVNAMVRAVSAEVGSYLDHSEVVYA